MKRFISVLLLMTLLFTTVACMTSCSEDDGAEISVYLSERLYNFDPAASHLDDAALAVLHMIYEPLFTMDDDGDVKKAMAEDYEFDKETGDLIIDIRESYWTNGRRVTAEDFIYAWKRIIRNDNSFDCAPLLYDIKNARYIKTATIPEGGSAENKDLHNFGAVAVDVDTIRISFESEDVDRDAFLRNLSNIALSPLNRLVYENNQGSYWHLSDNLTGYCNGPFRIKELNNEKGYFTLARNAEYHRPKDSTKDADYYVLPALIRTVWDLGTDVNDPDKKTPEYLDAMYDKMADSTVFYMSALSLEDRKNGKVQDDAEVSNALSTYSYIFDTTNPLFADAKVRRVLSQVIDRNEIINIVTFGEAATGLIAPGVWDATSHRNSKSFRNEGGDLISTSNTLSVEQAIQELADVKKGAFTISCENREEDRAIAEYIAGLWRAIGYQVTVDPCTAVLVEEIIGSEEDEKTIYYASRLHALYENRDFDVIAVDYQMFSTNALTPLANLSTNYHGGKVDLDAYDQSTDANKTYAQFRSENIAGYSNEQYDAQIESAMNTYDLKERAAYLHEAEKILMNDMPIIPLMFNQNFYVKHKHLKNLDVNYYGFTVFTEAKLKNYDERFFED